MRLLIVGPPGAGKGTQAARISENFGIPTISTGDIFRSNIANETELGMQVKAIVDKGDYVPDTLTNALVTDRLSAADAKGGFLLDGYPARPTRSATSTSCSRPTATRWMASSAWSPTRRRSSAGCTKRSGEQGRADDAEDAIRHRQEVYDRETAPLIEMFRERELLIEVDGLGSPDEVTTRIFRAFAERGLAPVS